MSFSNTNELTLPGCEKTPKNINQPNLNLNPNEVEQSLKPLKEQMVD